MSKSSLQGLKQTVYHHFMSSPILIHDLNSSINPTLLLNDFSLCISVCLCVSVCVCVCLCVSVCVWLKSAIKSEQKPQ